MSVDYRDRFSMSHHPFDKRYMHQHHIETSATLRLKQRVEWLLSERGLGIITGQSGVGKTAEPPASNVPSSGPAVRSRYLSETTPQ